MPFYLNTNLTQTVRPSALTQLIIGFARSKPTKQTDSYLSTDTMACQLLPCSDAVVHTHINWLSSRLCSYKWYLETVELSSTESFFNKLHIQHTATIIGLPQMVNLVQAITSAPNFLLAKVGLYTTWSKCTVQACTTPHMLVIAPLYVQTASQSCYHQFSHTHTSCCDVQKQMAVQYYGLMGCYIYKFSYVIAWRVIAIARLVCTQAAFVRFSS